jgi:hypothetical protein
MKIKKIGEFLNENVKIKAGKYETKLKPNQIVIFNETVEIDEKECIIYWHVELDETTEGINSINPVINKIYFSLDGVEQDVDVEKAGILSGDTELPLFIESVEYDDETGDFDIFFG